MNLHFKAGITHNEITESIATVKKQACLSHCTECFIELQSQRVKNGSSRFFLQLSK